MIGPIIDSELVPDPDADAELGPGDGEPIADEDLRGSRLLLVGRAAEAVDLDGSHGSAIELECTFHPSPGARFTWARLLLRLSAPKGVRILDVAPREVIENEPVHIRIDRKGNLSVGVQGVGTAGVDGSATKEFAVYHCSVQGSGASTALARWDFTENPHRRDGLGRRQSVVFTLPVTGEVSANVTVNARLARSRPGDKVVDAIRDLVLPTAERTYAVTFAITDTPDPAGGHFARA